MNKEDLLAYRTKLEKLSEKEKKLRCKYINKIINGKIQGPRLDKPSVDNAWVGQYEEDEIKMDYLNVNMIRQVYEYNKDNLDAFALDFAGKKITYRELCTDRLEETKKMFAKIGIKAGDVVSIAAPFFPETVYSIYALNALGVQIVLCDPRVPADKFKDYFNKSNSKYVIAYDHYYKNIEEIEDECGIQNTILLSPLSSLSASQSAHVIKDRVIGLTKNNYKKVKEKELTIKDAIKNVVDEIKPVKYTSKKAIKWNDLKEQVKDMDNIPDAPYDEDAPAITVFTSGTSGETKGATSSSKAINRLATQQKEAMRDATGEKFLLIMPPFIAYGLAVGLHGQLCRREELIMVPTFNIDNEAELLGKLVMLFKPQTIMGVPKFMVDLIKHKLLQSADLSFLKDIIIGGDGIIDKSEMEINDFCEKHNSSAKVTKGWGLTEANSVFTYTSKNNDISSAGITAPGNNIMIVKELDDDLTNDKLDVDDLEELSYGEEGEIFIRAEGKIIDYLDNEYESKRIFFRSSSTGQVWIRTKDLGKMKNDGQLFITGRKKRIIIRPDGHNISPFAIEKIVNKSEKVENCVVVGRPVGENEHGSYAIAYVELKDEYKDFDKSKIISELKQEVDSQLPPRDIASEYKFIEKIPSTDIGKVNYKLLEEQEKKLVLKRAN